MKNIIKTISCIVLSMAVMGCAKHAATGPNEAAIRYFESWLKVNYPDAKPSGLGIYVLEEEIGKGVTVKEDGYVYMDYIISGLDGEIAAYTDKETAKQLGTYDTTYYYGPKVVSTFENTIQAGLADAIMGMMAGGRKKVIIPGWLLSYQKYDTEEEYRNTVTNVESTIYDITIRDFADSIAKHEITLLERYMSDNRHLFDTRVTNDTTGFYYQPLSDNISTREFPKDTTIYINYTGRLLNGLVFDTTIEKVAKDNGLYSRSKSYGPVEVHWGEKYSDITLGSSRSTVVGGFALTLWQMHPMGKGMGLFYSPLGYTSTGSGNSIPAYSPLIFEIEIVKDPNK